MDDLLLDSFRRLLVGCSTTETVRLAQAGDPLDDLREAIVGSGFLDAMLPEDKGGADLALHDLFPLFVAAGEHLLPLPFAETIVARALMVKAGARPPDGAMIQLWPTRLDGLLRSPVPVAAAPGALALIQRGKSFTLLPTRPGERDSFGMVRAEVNLAQAPLVQFEAADVDLFDWAAAVTAATMAGAMSRVLAMTLDFANQRQQFGRALGKFQAIQHQLSVLAEKAVSARVAARIGLSMPGLGIQRANVAIAKAVVGDAAEAVAAIAHAVHGAIGMSEEHDLQLYTRRLKRWQLAFGTAAYWSRQVGAARIGQIGGTSVDFVRSRLSDAVAPVGVG